jgi:L-amino acid N-acyltransferase YncA
MNYELIKVNIREMRDDDWEAVAEIYKQGIDTGNATFQQEIPAWEEWDKDP